MSGNNQSLETAPMPNGAEDAISQAVFVPDTITKPVNEDTPDPVGHQGSGRDIRDDIFDAYDRMRGAEPEPELDRNAPEAALTFGQELLAMQDPDAQDDEQQGYVDPGLGAHEVERQQEQQPAKRQIKVNGRLVEMTDAELIAYAQKAVAAEEIGTDVLAEAKKARDELKALKEQGVAPPQTHQSENERETKPANVDDDYLDSIREQIQFGEPEQAKQAIADVTALAAQAAVAQIRNENLSRQTATIRQRDSQTLQEFAAQNDFLKDPRANEAFASMTAQVMFDEIRAAGAPAEHLEALKTPNQVIEYRRLMEAQGYKVMPTSEVLKAGRDRMLAIAQTVTGQSLTKPNPAPQPQQRNGLTIQVDNQQRKAGAMPQPTQTPRLPAQGGQISNAPVNATSIRREAMREMQGRNLGMEIRRNG